MLGRTSHYRNTAIAADDQRALPASTSLRSTTVAGLRRMARRMLPRQVLRQAPFVMRQIHKWHMYTPYFVAQKVIFIHVPKAAGTSVALALFGHDPGHYTALDYRNRNPGRFRAYFKFGFVRNPWDRLLSTYVYAFKHTRIYPNNQVSFIVEFPTFESFIMEWVNPKNIRRNYFMLPQVDYLCDRRGNLIVDFVGRFENLEEDFEALCSRLQVSATLPMVNATTHPDYRSQYTKEMADAVASAYRDDIEFFGYDFD